MCHPGGSAPPEATSGKGKTQEESGKDKESGTIPRLSVPLIQPQFGCVIDLRLYCHQPKSFNIPLSAQHIVPLLFFLLFCRCCCSLTVGCSFNMSLNTRRRLTEKSNERRILGVLNSCFFHINFVICHLSRLWGVDSC